MGKNLRAAREAAGLTQRDLAAQLGGKVDTQYVSNWERGVYRPNDQYLVKLAEVLGYEVAWFYGDPATQTKAA